MCNRIKIYEAAEKVKSDIGPITILINNAGIVSGTHLLGTSDEKIIRTFDVNVLAHFWTIKAFMPDMITLKKGHIVNVASLAGHSGMTKLVDYCLYFIFDARPAMNFRGSTSSDKTLA